MSISYHMVFKKEYTGSLNKYGGLPTHLPSCWPQIDGDDLTFLFQLYCDDRKLNLPDTLCIQGYQHIRDGHALSDIVVIQIPLDAKENLENIGVALSDCPDCDICFQEVTEIKCAELIAKQELHPQNGLPPESVKAYLSRQSTR